MSKVTLDAQHRYWLMGKELPGVTSLLKAAGDIDTTWFTEYARDRGTAVHDAILFDNDGTLDEAALDPEIKPYLDQYRQFRKLSKLRVIDAEKIVHSKSQSYAGKYDLYCAIHGRRTLIDFKTNNAPKWVEAQLGAYYFAAKEMGMIVHDLMAVVIGPNGFKFHSFDSNAAAAEWFSALARARRIA